jgi:hypothetical protein
MARRRFFSTPRGGSYNPGSQRIRVKAHPRSKPTRVNKRC